MPADEVGTLLADIQSLLSRITQMMGGAEMQPGVDEMDEDQLMESILNKVESGAGLSADEQALLAKRLAAIPISDEDDEDREDEDAEMAKSDANEDAEERVEGDQPDIGEESVSEVEKAVALLQALSNRNGRRAARKSRESVTKEHRALGQLTQVVTQLASNQASLEAFISDLLEGMNAGDEIVKAYREQEQERIAKANGGGSDVDRLLKGLERLVTVSDAPRPAGTSTTSIQDLDGTTKRDDGRKAARKELGGVMRQLFTQSPAQLPGPAATRPDGRV